MTASWPEISQPSTNAPITQLICPVTFATVAVNWPFTVACHCSQATPMKATPSACAYSTGDGAGTSMAAYSDDQNEAINNTPSARLSAASRNRTVRNMAFMGDYSTW
ncbi:hypothetical protein HUS70_11895 [Pandoraea nosoerga]|uniref:hypothetical protein n=1 Tax=Pandoraea nosoerga TaxID=2508296 RepID=UPI00197EA052|nr:hypothetical protein [Pandoraea nosoerga]MBN4666046.1 hypothetical protein [Pandoraea nosoerga]MBN4676220.1 hypothetical protein [Pandoraea nosoerga]MBN4681182.1 hypothetical protein [Pandoraea nosoerga]MBN4745330.1 hypothetical protein [Pandoraea nosoerga]